MRYKLTALPLSYSGDRWFDCSKKNGTQEKPANFFRFSRATQHHKNMRNQESADRSRTFRLGSEEYLSYLPWNAAVFAAIAYPADFP
jgi:hypothetical protein